MRNSIFWQFGIAIPLALAGVTATTSGNHVLAQLTPDDSLGVESSTVTVEQFRDLIRGGAIRDSALFHSFDEFNVGDGRSVLFDLQNNTDILNIFTRVTGSSSSQILGTLGVLNDLGNANLFLLNPNGITFGANASLQLNGSFFATTADGFGFDNFTFSASGQEAPPPLLTVSIPRFASFRDNPGDIAVNQGNLTVNQGQSLSLLGGNVTVTGSGNVNPRPFNLNAPDGRIEIGSVGGSGSVSLTQTDAGFVLDYEGIETFGDITLNQFAYVDTNGENGGSLQLQGRDITLSDRTWIFVDTLGAGTGGGIVVNSEQLILEDGSRLTADVLGSGQGGNITVNASDSVQITGVSEDGQSGSTIAAQVFSDFTGNAGDLTINTSQLLIQDGAQVDVNTFGQGDAGDITIRANSVNLDSGALIQANTSGQGDAGAISITATESVSLSNDSDAARLTAIANAVLSTGNGADLTITTPNLSLSGNTGVLTSTAGDGNAGNLIINASESISLTNGSQLQAAAIALNEASIGGAPGNIVINAEGASVTIDNSIVGTTIINSASNTGGGDISINASSFSLTNGSNLTSSLRSGQGDAGDITIQSNSVNLDSGAQIEASTFGQGDSGAINITATESVSLSNDSDATRATTIANIISSTGNGADLTITTPNLSLSGNTGVLTSTAGDGNAGNLIINASESIALTNGSQLQAAAIALNEASIGGSPGNIFINAESASVTIDNSIVGTVIDDSTSNTGGGDISINASSLSLNNASNLTSSLRSGQGDAGDITIQSNSVNLDSGARIQANTFGQGDAGAINITATESVSLSNDSDATRLTAIANAVFSTGNGADLTITTPNLSLSGNTSVLTSTAGDGNAGNLIINASESIALTNGSQLQAAAIALNEASIGGAPGNIFINAESASVTIDNSIVGTIMDDSTSNTGGGDISINASSLSLNNASNLTSSLRSGQGDAGDITINVTGTILIEGIGSGVFSTTAQGGVGNAGTINIDSEAIIIRDGGEISVDNQGTGLGGNIDVASDTLTLDDGRITANNSNDSDGGNITLNISDYILLLNGDGTPDLSDTLGGSLALISADSDGDGGNITINTTALVAIPGQDSDITANSTGENTQGGQVTIDAEVVLGIQASDNDLPGRNDITAISQSGSAGTVTINSPQTNPQQEDIEPPEDVTDETDVVSQNACSIGIGSQLANSGRGGLPQIPGFTIRNDTVDVDLVDEVLPAPPPEAIKPHHRTTVTFTDSEGEEFKPAMGAVLLPNGMVQFVDYNPTEVYRDMYASVGCSS